MSFLPGPHSATPSAHFHGRGQRHAHFHARAGLRQVLEAGRRDFGIVTSLRQGRGNVGTLLLLTASETGLEGSSSAGSEGGQTGFNSHQSTSNSLFEDER